MESDESVGIAYKGPLLESRKRYYWADRVVGCGRPDAASTEDAWWETGLLHPSDWKAAGSIGRIRRTKPIGQAFAGSGFPGRCVCGRAEEDCEFCVFRSRSRRSQRTADLSLAVRGDFIAKVNGHPIDSKHGWGSFDWRDISDELVVGNNSVEVTVTAPKLREGPWSSSHHRASWIGSPGKVTATNGAILRFPTDQHWMAASEGNSNWQQAKVVADLQDKKLGDPGPLPEPVANFGRVFPVAKSLRRARLYVTALGSYRVFLNDKRVGDDVITPDFTDYPSACCTRSTM